MVKLHIKSFLKVFSGMIAHFQSHAAIKFATGLSTGSCLVCKMAVEGLGPATWFVESGTTLLHGPAGGEKV